MARFQLSTAHSFGQTRLRAGKTIADPGNGLAGDFIVSNLSSANVTPGMVPLDASATTMKNASKYAGVSTGPIPGNDSIDA
jgi:hypothetical protein